MLELRIAGQELCIVGMVVCNINHGGSKNGSHILCNRQWMGILMMWIYHVWICWCM